MERIGLCLLAKVGGSLKVVLLVRPAMGSRGKYDTTADFLTNIEARGEDFFTVE